MEQQQRPNYQGNYQGNNFNNYNNQPSLKDLVYGQAKIMEGLSRKLASIDKVLENINNKLESFSSTIKNQLSFNKMLESQIAQLVAAIPQTRKVSDNAILLEILTTGYAGYRIHTEEDPKPHDSPIQGRISQDHAKTLTKAQTCSL